MEYQLFADLLMPLCKISEHFLNDINVSDHLLYRIALTLMAPGFFYPDNYFTFLWKYITNNEEREQHIH